MDIVYYLHNFPKVSETFILNEIVELEEKGHNIAIFALHDPEEDVEHEELDELDAEIYYPDFPTYSDFYKILRPKLLSPKFLKTLEPSQGIKIGLVQAYRTLELRKFIKKLDFKPDIIHTHFSVPSTLPVYSVSEMENIPWTVEPHAYDIFQEGWKEFSKSFLNNPNRIVTVSDYNKDYLEEEFEIKKPIDVVPVSIRPEKFKPQGFEEKNKIVSVARLVEKKGLKYGIEAFAQIKEDYPELEYEIIGKGPIKEELEQKASELGVREDVKFQGHVSDEKLVQSLEEAKIFLLPCIIAENGDRDAMPMVLKEAMALETPCISTKVSAIPELIENKEDGVIVEPKNPEAMGQAASELLNSEEERREIGKKARKKIVQNYDISKNVRKVEESFRKTIN